MGKRGEREVKWGKEVVCGETGWRGGVEKQRKVGRGWKRGGKQGLTLGEERRGEERRWRG